VDLSGNLRALGETPAHAAGLRARQAGPGGDELTQHDFDVVVPAARSVLSGCDERFAEDLGRILTGVVYGALAQFAAASIEITDIVSAIERAVYWLAKAHEGTCRHE
jgi:hypothetical protein